jgi:hypothetical protein
VKHENYGRFQDNHIYVSGNCKAVFELRVAQPAQSAATALAVDNSNIVSAPVVEASLEVVSQREVPESSSNDQLIQFSSSAMDEPLYSPINKIPGTSTIKKDWKISLNVLLGDIICLFIYFIYFC